MRLRVGVLLTLVILGTACSSSGQMRRRAINSDAVLLDDVEERTFHYFWDLADPNTALVPDRSPTPSFSSVAAVGSGLMAYAIGAERGYVTRPAAAARVLKTLQFLYNAPQGPNPVGMTGYHGFLYHFIDMKTGARYRDVEVSTIDTTLFLAGALFCQGYFDGDNETERAIRDTADKLYRRAEWDFFLARPPLVCMGWTPENGLHTYDWRGYNEAMVLYILALGSPTHTIDAAAWNDYTSTYRWADFYGQTQVNFGPLFGHQSSHVWIDFRGIQDPFMRAKGIDYFENSRRSTLSQQAYATANPGGWRGYGVNMWGLTACDGPLDGIVTIDGRPRTFVSYEARAAADGEIRDDGTIAPNAAIASMPFTPEISLAAMKEMQRRFGDRIYQKYGFLDSFNETLDVSVPVLSGIVVPGTGWFDTDYLGIDQGLILGMIENYRTGLIWKVMKKNPYIIQGLRRAGFTGGWLGTSGKDSSSLWPSIPMLGPARENGPYEAGSGSRKSNTTTP